MGPFTYRFKGQANFPDWNEFDSQRKHINDWRTYVTGEVRAAWDEIPLIGRCAIVACCEEMANREEWE